MEIKGNCIAATEDEHGPIYIFETKRLKILSFDGKIFQSSMKLNNINGLHLAYTQAMMTGLFFIPTIKTATIMGLGAGSMAKCLLNNFLKLNVHAIEYREAVALVAKKYFHLPDTERLVIHIDNAIDHMKNTDIKSDIIFSDLYNSEGMEPKQVQSSYLFNCKNALNKYGVLVLNICHSTIALKEELDDLLALTFDNRLLSFDVDGGNRIVLGFKNEIPELTQEELLTKAKSLQEQMNIPMETYAKLLLEQ